MSESLLMYDLNIFEYLSNGPMYARSGPSWAENSQSVDLLDLPYDHLDLFDLLDYHLACCFDVLDCLCYL